MFKPESLSLTIQLEIPDSEIVPLNPKTLTLNPNVDYLQKNQVTVSRCRIPDNNWLYFWGINKNYRQHWIKYMCYENCLSRLLPSINWYIDLYFIFKTSAWKKWLASRMETSKSFRRSISMDIEKSSWLKQTAHRLHVARQQLCVSAASAALKKWKKEKKL